MNRMRVQAIVLWAMGHTTTRRVAVVWTVEHVGYERYTNMRMSAPCCAIGPP